MPRLNDMHRRALPFAQFGVGTFRGRYVDSRCLFNTACHDRRDDACSRLVPYLRWPPRFAGGQPPIYASPTGLPRHALRALFLTCLPHLTPCAVARCAHAFPPGAHRLLALRRSFHQPPHTPPTLPPARRFRCGRRATTVGTLPRTVATKTALPCYVADSDTFRRCHSTFGVVWRDKAIAQALRIPQPDWRRGMTLGGAPAFVAHLLRTARDKILRASPPRRTAVGAVNAADSPLQHANAYTGHFVPYRSRLRRAAPYLAGDADPAVATTAVCVPLKITTAGYAHAHIHRLYWQQRSAWVGAHRRRRL